MKNNFIVYTCKCSYSFQESVCALLHGFHVLTIRDRIVAGTMDCLCTGSGFKQ